MSPPTSDELTTIFREAAEAGAATRADLARQADYSPETFELYANAKDVSPQAAEALARTLLRRAARSAELGGRLLRAAHRAADRREDDRE